MQLETLLVLGVSGSRVLNEVGFYFILTLEGLIARFIVFLSLFTSSSQPQSDLVGIKIPDCSSGISSIITICYYSQTALRTQHTISTREGKHGMNSDVDDFITVERRTQTLSFFAFTSTWILHRCRHLSMLEFINWFHRDQPSTQALDAVRWAHPSNNHHRLEG